MRPSLLLLACILLLTATAAGQETPTERSAAADVIKRMNELESFAATAPTWSKRLSAPDKRRDAVMARAKELMNKELLAMADDITKHPEVGWHETRSVKILTDYLPRTVSPWSKAWPECPPRSSRATPRGRRARNSA